MSEQEIFEKLCSHIMVIDNESSFDDPFFKHCYDICVEDKEKLTESSLWEILDREHTLLLVKERKAIEELRKYMK